jgi:hypothetical protein
MESFGVALQAYLKDASADVLDSRLKVIQIHTGLLRGSVALV